MRKIVFPILFIFCSDVVAQNVGIGTSTPTEQLDVNGNINVSGTIKANGTDGTANQVLGKNSTGTLTWMDVSEYKNFKVFTNTSTTTWTVPAGVTKLVIEAWGAGGGGSKGGGGASGNYFFAKADVIPGNAITIKCGLAGARGDASTNGIASNGGTTTVNVPPNAGSIAANGGGGANNFSSGYPGGLWPQAVTHNVPVIHYTGQHGSNSTEQYFQYQSGVFVTTINYGNGGNSPFVPPNGDKGGFVSFYTSTPSNIIKYHYPANGGGAPGGGGAGGPDVSGTSYSSYGGNGMVILRW